MRGFSEQAKLSCRGMSMRLQRAVTDFGAELPFANMKKAYERVCANKGSAGVDCIGTAEFKAHLRQHWPTVKAKLQLAGFARSAYRLCWIG